MREALGSWLDDEAHRVKCLSPTPTSDNANLKHHCTANLYEIAVSRWVHAAQEIAQQYEGIGNGACGQRALQPQGTNGLICP